MMMQYVLALNLNDVPCLFYFNVFVLLLIVVFREGALQPAELLQVHL